MSNLHTNPNLADRGESLGMRLITRAGGLDALKNTALREKVEKVLYRSARAGFKAQTIATRSFAKRAAAGPPKRTRRSTPPQEFDLRPTEDQEMIRQAARDLAMEILRPAAAAADTDRAVPDEVRQQAAQLGLTLLGVPTELDGIAEEASALTSVLVLEELARGDMGLATAVMSSAAVASAFAAYGDAAQQATYLPAFTDENDLATGSLALQEAGPLFDPAHPTTAGHVQGSTIVLNGTKTLVANADTADLFIVSALVDGEPRLVVVPRGTPGMSIDDEPAMGIRAAATGTLVLRDVTVPAENLLGTTADHADVVDRGRLAWAAMAVGTAQAALEQVTQYALERKAFGEPIAHRQAVAFAIADIAIELEGLRLVTWRAAARLDRGDDATAQIAHARALTAHHGARIGSDAVQLLGGHGFVKEFDNERWYRDLRGAGILEGMLLV